MEIPSIPLFVFYNILVSSSPLLVESILLIRLWAIYPPRTTPLKTFLAIFIPITLVKLARLANAISFVVCLSAEIRAEQSVFGLLHSNKSRFPNYAIEWFLQVADNTSASVLFLTKLNEVRTFRSRPRGWSECFSFMSQVP
jgi:hypothetical protein